MLIDPKEHSQLTVEHLKYQRGILSAMADGLCEYESEFTDYLIELNGICRVIACFDTVIRYYEGSHDSRD